MDWRRNKKLDGEITGTKSGRDSTWRAGDGWMRERLDGSITEGVQHGGLEEDKSFWGDYLDGKLKGFSIEGWRSTSLSGEIT